MEIDGIGVKSVADICLYASASKRPASAFITAVIPPHQALVLPSYLSKITFLINVRGSFELSFQKSEVVQFNLIFVEWAGPEKP